MFTVAWERFGRRQHNAETTQSRLDPSRKRFRVTSAEQPPFQPPKSTDSNTIQAQALHYNTRPGHRPSRPARDRRRGVIAMTAQYPQQSGQGPQSYQPQQQGGQLQPQALAQQIGQAFDQSVPDQVKQAVAELDRLEMVCEWLQSRAMARGHTVVAQRADDIAAIAHAQKGLILRESPFAAPMGQAVQETIQQGIQELQQYAQDPEVQDTLNQAQNTVATISQAIVHLQQRGASSGQLGTQHFGEQQVAGQPFGGQQAGGQQLGLGQQGQRGQSFQSQRMGHQQQPVQGQPQQQPMQYQPQQQSFGQDRPNRSR